MLEDTAFTQKEMIHLGDCLPLYNLLSPGIEFGVLIYCGYEGLVHKRCGQSLSP